MISPGDISVVVQGPISWNSEIKTVESLRSIREYLPGAEIILSTWKDQNVNGLEYDRLILNEDPGAPERPDGLPFNLNRMLANTCAGLLAATRPYSVKMRTDCKLKNANLLGLTRMFPPRVKRYHYFIERVLACELFFRNPANLTCPHLFHPSDIFHFGQTKDLIALWNLSLHKDLSGITDWSKWPYTPEQYLWLTYLRHAHGVEVTMKNLYDFSIRKAVMSEISIINNFAIYSCDQIGLKLQDSLAKNPACQPEFIYTNAEWNRLAQLAHWPFFITFRMFLVQIKHLGRTTAH